MDESLPCKAQSDFDAENGPMAPRRRRSGREHACAGRCRVRRAVEDEDATGAMAAPRLWDDWSLEPWSRDPAERSNPSDATETGDGDEPPLWRDWDPLHWLLEPMLDQAMQGLGPLE